MNNSNSKERECKVALYNDRVTVQLNVNNALTLANVKNRVLPTKKRDAEFPYMTKIQYRKAIKKDRNKLYDLDIQAYKSIYITLTTSAACSWNDMVRKFQNFILCLKRHFGKVYYIRAIETHEKGKRFHIHTIIMFENGIPTEINKKWIKKHWKQKVVDYQKVIEPYGIIEYMTIFKDNNINPKNGKYTKLPQFVQVISHSEDFPESEKKEMITTKTEMTKIVDSFNEYCLNETGNKAYVFTDGHMYRDKNTGEIKYSLDRLYLHKSMTKKR